MTKAIKIDFVSDVSCPWCIIGLRALEEALDRTSDVVDATVTFQPFELNPAMPPEGQNIVEHIGEKYGSSPEQSAASRQLIKDRAAELGFTIATSGESRIYNTFDAHRLLHWAETKGRQKELKNGLFTAYFTDGQNPSDPEVLVSAAEKAGLSAQEAREVLSSGRYADEVRQSEQLWQSRGIHAVPAVIINDRYLISGGQPPEVFEKALRAIAQEADAPLSVER
ncbi:MAG TPA: DsbA family oxidoreductase [Allosphingosinicella sp.]|nr:DsbA family oxidoreductase [Allosphingosinicella sp.]